MLHTLRTDSGHAGEDEWRLGMDDAVTKGLRGVIIGAWNKEDEHARLEMLKIVMRNIQDKPLVAGRPRCFRFQRCKFVARVDVGEGGEDAVVVKEEVDVDGKGI